MKTLIALGSLLALFFCAASHGATPTAATRKPSHVTANSATLLGRVLPGPADTAVHFEWGLTTNLGNSTALQPLSAGRRAVLVESPISGLNPLTTYFCRVVASNTNGVVAGRIVQFITQGLPPLHSGAAQVGEVGEGRITFFSDVQPFPGVQPNNSLARIPIARVFWQWGLTTNYGQITPGATVLNSHPSYSGTNVVRVWAVRGATGLKPFITYHFRGVVVNPWGTSYGPDGTFVLTQATPAVTLREKKVGPYSATLQGRARAYAGTTGTWYFQYGPNLTDAQTTPQPLTRPGNRAVVVTLTNLSDQITYRYRLVVEVNGVPYYGDERSFVTVPPPSPPVVQTLHATNITGTSAELVGAVTPNTLSAGSYTVYFHYGLTTNYGQVVGAFVSNGTVPYQVRLSVSNLQFASTYHFKLEFHRVQTGQSYFGADQTFTTLRIPVVTTQPAIVTSNLVTLNALVNPNGAVASVQFAWGPTTAYGSTTTVQVLPSNSVPVPVSANIGPLAVGEYHFKAFAVTADGTGSGSDAVFAVLNPDILLTDCSEQALRLALVTNRVVRFSSDCFIQLTNTLTINSPATLDAAGHAVTISGGNSVRIFNVSPGASLKLLGLTIANGRLVGTNGMSGGVVARQPGESVAGAGIYLTNATLIASNCVFTNCTLQAGDGANTTGLFDFGPGGGAAGGAIYALNSSVMLEDCQFVNNAAKAGISGITGAVHDAARNPGAGAGGAVYATGGTLIVTNSAFRGNGASSSGGAIAFHTSGGCTLNQCEFTNNLSGGSGGAVSFSGSGLDVRKSSFRRNSAVGNGLGYGWPVTSTSGSGGAMTVSAGNVTITECDFDQNSSIGSPARPVAAGAVTGGNGSGGALTIVGGTTTLTSSSFRHNSVAGANGLFLGGLLAAGPTAASGGAIQMSQGGLEIVNCTLAHNSVQPGYYQTSSAAGSGGGLHGAGGTIAMSSCTLASNRVTNVVGTNASGGGIFLSSASMAITNSIFQGNALNATPSSNVSGTIVDFGGNISSDSTPVWANGNSLNNVDALLLPLADNGGPTPTMALGAGSPAFNWATANFPPTDQRGAARPTGSGADSGAWEGSVLVPSFRSRR